MSESKVPEGEVLQETEDEISKEASGVAGEESESQQLSEQLAAKEEEIRQLQDRILRMAAEMENTRKRLEREKTDAISFANESLMKDLLPIVDNLERAMQHGEGETDVQALLEGLKLTHKVFLDVLGRHGCAPFDAVGKCFDPNFHEAVAQQESSEHEERTVMQEFQRGYTLRERLLRPAMVLVSKTPC